MLIKGFPRHIQFLFKRKNNKNKVKMVNVKILKVSCLDIRLLEGALGQLRRLLRKNILKG